MSATKRSFGIIGEIAKKEFSDHLTSNVFLIFAATFTIVVVAQSYVSGMHLDYTKTIFGATDLMKGFIGISNAVGRFAPIIGIVMGFDAVSKETRSASMNVLLTHPVFRDNVILGNVLGASLCILLSLFLSVNLAVGTMFIVSGVAVSMEYIIRIEIFVFLAFLYSMSFLAVSVLISTIVNKSSSSLIYSIAIWLFITILFSQLVQILAYTINDDPVSVRAITLDCLQYVPGNHYAQATSGLHDVVRHIEGTSTIGGIFDTAHSLSTWLHEFWSSLVYLIVTPVLFLIASFIAFLRKDITL